MENTTENANMDIYDEKIIIGTIKKYMHAVEICKERIGKINIVKYLFTYLCQHMDFIERHKKFKRQVLKKIEEIKKNIEDDLEKDNNEMTEKILHDTMAILKSLHEKIT